MGSIAPAGGQPAWPLRAIRWFHQAGLVRRGHSWLIAGLATLSPQHALVEISLPEVGKLVVDLRDRASVGYFAEAGMPHEARDIALFKELAKGCNVLFDVGAHVGYFSRLAATANPDCHIHAFEPNPKLYPLLTQNLKDSGRAIAHQLAVARSSGRRKFYVAASSDLSSLVRNVGEAIDVEATSLDDYCLAKAIPKVDLIKCDVEGGELEVIQGAGRLQQKSPPIWLLENQGNFHRELGISGKDFAGSLNRHSTEPLSYFYVVPDKTSIRLCACNPEVVSWETAWRNIWIVPERCLDKVMQAVARVRLPGPREGGN